jgi:hypothetical protein
MCTEVRHIFQAISIHESRATYHEQVAQQQSSVSNQVLKQMWFLGNHSDMARNTGYSGFADAPLAWMIGQLQHYLHLRFDEGKLHKRFRSYSESMNLGRPISGAASTSATANNSSTTIAHVQTVGTVGTPLPCWIKQDIKVFNAFKTFCHGWNQRTPGRYGNRTFEEAHITIRLRGFGRKKADLVMIPGYQAVGTTGKWVRFRQPSWRSKFLRWITNNKIPTALPFIREGKMLPLEAALLGLSWYLDKPGR